LLFYLFLDSHFYLQFIVSAAIIRCQNNLSSAWRQLVLELKRLLGVNFSSAFMAGGRGRHGQVSNEEVPYYRRDVQDVTIEDLQRQVTDLTQHLVAQNLERDREMDDRDSDSSIENPYHNPVLGREHRYGDLRFKVELSEFAGTLQAEGFIDWLHEEERIFDYKEVPDRMKVKLVAIKLKDCASTWWKQLK